MPTYARQRLECAGLYPPAQSGCCGQPYRCYVCLGRLGDYDPAQIPAPIFFEPVYETLHVTISGFPRYDGSHALALSRMPPPDQGFVHPQAWVKSGVDSLGRAYDMFFWCIGFGAFPTSHTTYELNIYVPALGISYAAREDWTDPGNVRCAPPSITMDGFTDLSTTFTATVTE